MIQQAQQSLWVHGACRKSESCSGYHKQKASGPQPPWAAFATSEVEAVNRNYTRESFGTSSLCCPSNSPNSDLLVAMWRDRGLDHVYSFHLRSANPRTSHIPVATYTQHWQLPPPSVKPSRHLASLTPVGNLSVNMEHLDFTAVIVCPEVRSFDGFVSLLQNFHGR